MISEDLEELFEIADRIAVMFEGRILDVMPVAEARGRPDRAVDGRGGGQGVIQLRLEPRLDTPAWLGIALPLLAILATLALCSALILLAGANVLDAYARCSRARSAAASTSSRPWSRRRRWC